MSDRVVRYKLKIEPHESNDKALSDIGKATKAATKAAQKSRVEETKKGTSELKRDAEGLTAANKKELEKRGRDLKKKLDKEIREAERAAKAKAAAEKKAIKEQLAEEKKAAATRDKALKAQVAAQKKAAAAVRSEWNKADSQIEAGRAAITEGLVGSTEAVAKFGRGFAALGVSGEENTKVLLEKLVKIQATFDMVTGGITAYVQITKAVKAFALASSAASTQQKIARAQAIAGIEAEIAAETTLAATRGKSAAAGVAASAARGGGAGVVGAGAAGLAGGGAAAAIGGSGAGAAGTAGGTAAGGTAAAGGALGTGATIGVFATFAASMLAAGTVIKESLTGSATAVDSWSMWIGKGEARFANWIHLIDDGSRGFEKLTKAVAKEEVARTRRDIHAALGQASDIELLSMERRRAKEQQYASPEERLAQLDSAALGARSQAEDLARQTGGGDEGIAMRRNAIIAIRNEEMQIARERLSTQQQITRARRDEIKEAIAGAERELELTKQKVDTAKERLGSAKQRFGQLSAAEQKQLLDIGKKAQAGGKLTKEERAKLASVGTEAATGIARSQDEAEAEAAGFSSVFGSSERATIAAGEKKQQSLVDKIDIKRELDVQLETDEQQLIQDVADEVNRILDERDAEIREGIRIELERRQGQLAATSDKDIMQGAAR